MTEAELLAGRELSGLLFAEVVRPILAAGFPSLNYAAALIGTGSEVLGFDDDMSRDHDFGPRMFIFLRSADSAAREAIHAALDRELPTAFRGFAVDMPKSRLSARFNVDGRQRSHRVIPLVFDEFVAIHFGPSTDISWDVVDWLTVSSQSLLEFTAGEVFHDGPRELTTWREHLSWYPHDVWLYLLAAGWQRIREEEHLWQRAGWRGDELGAGVLGARLVRDVIRQCFLIERRYAPYPKWLGRAFAALACAREMSPLLQRALYAGSWPQRGASLLAAFEMLAELHNDLGITAPLATGVAPFMDRPFPVIYGGRFVRALTEVISDPVVKALATNTLIGNVDQWSDNTLVTDISVERPTLRRMYD